MTSEARLRPKFTIGPALPNGLGATPGNRLKFLAVGASGLVVNQLLILALTELAGLFYLASAIIATVGSSTWNFILADRWAFGDRRPLMGTPSRYGSFLAINFGLLLVRAPILVAMTELAHVGYAWSNLVTLLGLTVVRLMFADLFVWRSESPAVPHAPADAPAGVHPVGEVASAAPSRYRYDIAGILTIHSDVVLRELAHFQTSDVRKPSIRIKIGLVASRPTTRIRFEENDTELVYREHLGPMAANFSVKQGDPIEIKVNPLLALSPHVVYTNIVEAFLRFKFVSKGYVLLHSAALADSRGATLMSAQTDTGKTSAVITLVRRRGYRFLSDDMTIIDAAAGDAISYPKPMTLSFHTMGVAKDGRLTFGDRAALSIQSRLHSKSGRQVGRSLGNLNIPIMSVNSVVQAIVPPPKHRIEALFECEVGGRAPIRNVVLMERGPESLEPVDLDVAVRRLIENTDDAYGFPPFATFAPRIRIDGANYEELRQREVELLRQAIAGARLLELSVPGHGWADALPAIIDAPTRVAVGPGLPDAVIDAPTGVAVGPGLPDRVSEPALPWAGLEPEFVPVLSFAVNTQSSDLIPVAD